ncbi:MAG: ketopantoate reductase family protein [Nitrososphaerales archaeon]
MRIAVMGAGGVGGYFGGLLAKNGEDVTFIARGAHLRAMKQEGLRVESVHGDFALRPVRATGDPASVGPVDVVLFATKTDQLDEAAQAMKPLIGPETVVVPLHNGVDAAERTAGTVGEQHVLGGLCYVGSMIAAPGVIRQESPFRRVIVGEMPWSPHRGAVTPRVQAIADALTAAGATGETSTDIQAARWTKFAFIAPFAGVASVARVPAGEINAVPETRQMLHDAIAEVVAVAAAEGVRLPEEPAKTRAFCDTLAPHITPSMQRDVIEGKPSELESLIGVVVRKGRALRVPVPNFEFFYASLLPQERRARRLPA